MELYEKTSFYLDVAFTTPDETPMAIDRLEWWVVEPRSQRVTHERQQIDAPGNSVTLVIPAEASICEGARGENRVVILKATEGEHIAHQPFYYTVLALPRVPYDT